ncbi:aminoglycoside phosphotransferase family protein [Streptomyces alkaliterrae]|uniref:Phosphotransferase n=1 Tax=Streptomyces alkaliterrae TaxID=2213162 RepID=A0A5P0YYP4_9ACTN|nr:aminoglycoside phosphotransferase family protein [Streptomyces alkaliterrae]MBB1256648.1 phosphotransferase [Streptomyces alkaliterrae]MBB1261222.1 phosphotransferase [Streptomyces alkaliterrae]MQS05403.1 phosphotransferase [Streptomyces alkaliterrae]
MEAITRVPAAARSRLRSRFGSAADAWCDSVPALVEQLSGRWGLTPVEAAGGGTSRVFRCLPRGSDESRGEAWLKLTPDREVARQEALALTAWSDTSAVVGLLATELSRGALLLRPVRPGVPATYGHWNEPEVSRLLAALRASSPPDSPAPQVPELTERVSFVFDLAARRLGTAPVPGPITSALLDQARRAALRLASTGPRVLVHGDLHPGNVLTGPANGRLVAIDPRPSIGDPDFDVIDWALEGRTCEAELRARIASFAALVPGLDADRVAAWCRALAPLVALPLLRTQPEHDHTRFLVELATG